MAYFVTNLTSGKYYPVNNPINFTVNSSNSGNCNFRYVARIFINNTYVFSSKLFPDPTTGYGFFQISRILQDWITNVVPKTPYTTYFNVASGTTVPIALQTVYVQIGEEYDSSVNCDGTVTSYLNQAQSNTIYCYNGALGYEENISYTYTDYLVSNATSTTKKFLTNSPRTIDVTNNDSYYLDFLSDTPVNAAFDSYITINWKDTSTSQFAMLSPTLAQAKRYRVAVGPWDINKIYGSTILDWSLVNSYQIYLRYNTNQVSETFTFKMRAPKPYETRIAWINQMGGIDHFTFYHRNQKSYDITRKTFKKSLQSNYASSWTYQVGDRQDTTYGISAVEKHVVSSYCNRYDAAWLNEIYFSPDVWTYNYTDPCATHTTWKMLPIVVSDTSVKEEQKMTKPIMYTINYTTGYSKNLIKG